MCSRRVSDLVAPMPVVAGSLPASVRNLLRELLWKIYEADIVNELINYLENELGDACDAGITPDLCQLIAHDFSSSLPHGFRVCFLRHELFFVHFQKLKKPFIYSLERVPSIVVDERGQIVERIPKQQRRTLCISAKLQTDAHLARKLQKEIRKHLNKKNRVALARDSDNIEKMVLLVEMKAAMKDADNGC